MSSVTLNHESQEITENLIRQSQRELNRQVETTQQERSNAVRRDLDQRLEINSITTQAALRAPETCAIGNKH